MNLYSNPAEIICIIELISLVWLNYPNEEYAIQCTTFINTPNTDRKHSGNNAEERMFREIQEYLKARKLAQITIHRNAASTYRKRLEYAPNNA